mgnify:CR=1 FL=1
MCVILILEPSVMPPKDALWNAVYNNWHSYGLITKGQKPKDFSVKKVCPKEEVDPQEVWDILEEHKGLQRILHLRHNTAGATSEENTHPFEVFKSPDDEIYFMHNGTLYEFKSKKVSPSKFQQGSWITEDDPDGPSDTKNFVDQVLIPFVSSIQNPSGRVADLSNPILDKVIRKYWSAGENRGLLVSKTQDFYKLGNWCTMKSEDGQEFLSSNDSYFEKVLRGPEKIRRELRQKEIEAQAMAERQKAGAQTSSPFRQVVPITSLVDLDLSAGLGQFELSSSVKGILNDYNVWDRESAAEALTNLTKQELESLVDEKKDCVILMDWIFADYASLYGEFCELSGKLSKAQKHIETMAGELKLARKAQGESENV